MTHSTTVHQTFLLLLITICLGACLLRVFWQLEQVRARRLARPPGERPARRD